MVGADKVTAIRMKAEVLAGQSLGDNGDLLVEMAVDRACTYCHRSDVPQEMEQAVAALVLAMRPGEGDVKSVTRGDTAVAYFDSGVNAALTALNPFRRLATVGEGEP